MTIDNVQVTEIQYTTERYSCDDCYTYTAGMVGLTRQQMKKYEKYVLPIDKAIMRMYDGYKEGGCKKHDFMKALRHLEDARQYALQACGM